MLGFCGSKTVYSSQIFFYYSTTPITIFHSIYMFLKLTLFLQNGFQTILEVRLEYSSWKKIRIVETYIDYLFHTNEGGEFVVSNDQLFRFQLIPSCSNFDVFSLSIPNNFRFYLYFDYLFDFILLIHVNLNTSLLLITGSRLRFKFGCTRHSTSFKML